MPDDTPAQPTGGSNWSPTQAYSMAAVCLVIGLVFGYLFHGSSSVPPVSATAATAPVPKPMSRGQMKTPTLEDMKRMADKRAEPLLAKLKTDPQNSQLLNEVGTIYKSTHQFKEAAQYYQQALDADPKNVAARTDLASCLFYQGDADGALKQIEQSLAYQPKDANSLFNLGMIKLQAKSDRRGAISAWQKLLKLNPDLPAEKKSVVQRLIAQAQQPNISN